MWNLLLIFYILLLVKTLQIHLLEINFDSRYFYIGSNNFQNLKLISLLMSSAPSVECPLAQLFPAPVWSKTKLSDLINLTIINYIIIWYKYDLINLWLDSCINLLYLIILFQYSVYSILYFHLYQNVRNIISTHLACKYIYHS